MGETMLERYMRAEMARLVADIFEQSFFASANEPHLRKAMEGRAKSFENGFSAGVEWYRRQIQDATDLAQLEEIFEKE
jgi:hypothetical protein